MLSIFFQIIGLTFYLTLQFSKLEDYLLALPKTSAKPDSIRTFFGTITGKID